MSLLLYTDEYYRVYPYLCNALKNYVHDRAEVSVLDKLDKAGGGSTLSMVFMGHAIRDKIIIFGTYLYVQCMFLSMILCAKYRRKYHNFHDDPYKPY